MASNSTSSNGKGCGATIAVVGGIVALIAGLITIVQYFTGRPTFTALFEGTAVVTQATPTATPTLMPTPTPTLVSTPTVSSPPPSSTQASFTPIAYNSFWTWFWWAIVGGFLISPGAFIQEWRMGNSAEDMAYAALGGMFVGSLFSVLCGFVCSLLLNLFHAPYAFLISIGITGVVVGLSLAILFGEDTSKNP